MESSTRSSAVLVFWSLLAIVAFVFLCGALIGGCKSINHTEPTEVALIRNGGMLDTRDIREIRPPTSGYKISGLYSEVRKYIAGNEVRYFGIADDPSLGDKGAEISVPTRDGVEVGINGQVLFRTAFTDPNGNLTEESEALLREFDEKFGNRNFTGSGGDSHKPWEGEAGWQAFLFTMVKPVIENAFRREVGSVNCAELVSSCALVQSSGKIDLTALSESDNQATFAKIQDSVQEQIDEGVEAAMGGEYLTDFRVQLTKVTLPKDVQVAINRAQASFAQIAESRAQNIQSKFEAARNARLAKAYQDSPVLGQIEMAKILADGNATIILDGTGGLGLNVGGR